MFLSLKWRLQGNNSEGANSFLYEQFFIVWINSLHILSSPVNMRGSRGRTGGSDPLKNHKIGFPSQTGPGTLENHKATKPIFNHRAIISPLAKRYLMAFHWFVDDGPLIYSEKQLKDI